MKKNVSQLKTGIILSYLNMGLGNLIPFFYTPVMLKLLGQNEYGLYKLSSSVTSYLSLISLGLGGAITRYLIKAREEEGEQAEKRMLGLFIIIFRIIAIVSFVIGILIVLNLDIWYMEALSDVELSRMCILVFLMVCNTALSFSVSPYISAVSSHEKFIILQIINILTTCISPLLNIFALLLGFGSIGMAVFSMGLTVLCRVIYSRYVKVCLKLVPDYRSMPIRYLKEICVFSFWIFISNVVAQLYNATDTVMIGMIPTLAVTGVAIYSIGNTFNQIVFSLTTGVSSLIAPKVNKMIFQGTSLNELTELAIRIGRIQCYIFSLLVTGFIAFGKPFIYLYAGPGYEEAYWVAILMMIPNMVPLVQSVCLSIITAQNKHRFRALVYLMIAIVNVIGTWCLMHKWGIIGAALMTGIALVVGQGFIMNWYYQRKIGLNMVQFWMNIVPIYLVPTVLCLATLYFATWIDFYNISSLMIGIVIYSLIYVGVNYKFVINNYEHELLREFFANLNGRYRR